MKIWRLNFIFQQHLTAINFNSRGSAQQAAEFADGDGLIFSFFSLFSKAAVDMKNKERENSLMVGSQ